MHLEQKVTIPTTENGKIFHIPGIFGLTTSPNIKKIAEKNGLGLTTLIRNIDGKHPATAWGQTNDAPLCHHPELISEINKEAEILFSDQEFETHKTIFLSMSIGTLSLIATSRFKFKALIPLIPIMNLDLDIGRIIKYHEGGKYVRNIIKKIDPTVLDIPIGRITEINRPAPKDSFQRTKNILSIYGEKDILLPERDIQTFSRNVPHATIKKIPDMQHLNWSDPEFGVVEIIDQFIQKILEES